MLPRVFVLIISWLQLIYRFWNIRCEPFSSYPRTYDLLHANYLFSHYKTKGEGCLLEDIMLEMDRLIRPLVITFLNCHLSWLSAYMRPKWKFIQRMKIRLLLKSDVKCPNVFLKLHDNMWRHFAELWSLKVWSFFSLCYLIKQTNVKRLKKKLVEQ